MSKKITTDITPYSYSWILSIEEPFYSVEYVESWRDWIKTNLSLFYALSAVYVLMALAGQRYMKHKPRLELRLPLIIWNIILALFSIFSTIRVLPGLFLKRKLFFLEIIFNFGRVLRLRDEPWL
jgi:elongation of very long chain fatty acids protein 6